MAKSDVIRAAIVDDEEPARRLLREYLVHVPDIEVVAECANGFETVKTLAEQPVDLLFLDIQMPKLDGFEVLELLETPASVIFTTAYDEFALRAFQVHAVDYLLKPFSLERLEEALEQFRRRKARVAAPNVAARSLSSLQAETRRRSVPLPRILIREGAQVHVIPVAAIDYVEARDDYICVATSGKRLMKQQTLGELESLLDRERFVRVHRSFILNVTALARIELYAKDSRLAILKDGTHLPVSRAGYARLRELL